MNAIVAVYQDWGIGANGTQPVVLSADRKFFRETTRGATVVAGRKTVMDFPNQSPLPNRKNIVLSTNHSSLPGFTVCHSVDELLDTLTGEENVFIIGGASIYKQLLPYCDTVYVTKLQTSAQSDVFFTNLDENDEWQLSETLLTGSENGISYSMVKYIRTIQKKTPH